MADNTITVVGNVTRDPELKFLNCGQAALRLSVAVNRRWQNRQTQEWEEQTSLLRRLGYGPMAENAANSLTKGARVVVTGRLEQRSLGDRERREALDRRDHRRRDRPEPALGDGRRHPHPARRRRQLPIQRPPGRRATHQ